MTRSCVTSQPDRRASSSIPRLASSGRRSSLATIQRPSPKPLRGPIASSRASSTCSAIATCRSRMAAAGAKSTGIWIQSTSAARRPTTGAASRISTPRLADHKVVWELNRHQSWLQLGRAWLVDGRHPLPRRLHHAVRWLDAQQPAAPRDELGQHAGTGVSLPVMDLGAALFFGTAGRHGGGTHAVECRSPAWARPSAHADRAQPVDLLQPEHASHRRGAGALCRGANVAGIAPVRAMGSDRPRAADCADLAAGARSTAGTSSSRPITIATHSTSICWRSPSRVRPPIRWRRRSPRPSNAWPSTRARCPTTPGGCR